MEKPERLFKLVGPARVDVIESGMICFSSRTQLNDELEGIPPIIEPIRDRERALIDEKIVPRFDDGSIATQMLAGKLLESGWTRDNANSFAEFILQFPEVKGQIESFKSQLPGLLETLMPLAFSGSVMDAVLEKFGVLSMTERIDNAPMWAHYGAEYAGFGIQFNLDDPFFSDIKTGRFLPRKVVYKNRQIEGLMDIKAEDILHTKAADWANEQEWRMLRD